jgi:hypothetical protein
MMTDDRPVVSRYVMELATACAVGAIGVAVVIGALEYQIGWDDAGPQPGYFPFFVGLLIIIGSIGVAGQAFLTYRRSGEVFLGAQHARRVAAFFLPIVAFVAAALLVGIYVAMALYLFGVMTVQGRYRLAFAALVSGGTTVGFFVLFEIIFTQPLLKGPVEAWLGFY